MVTMFLHGDLAYVASKVAMCSTFLYVLHLLPGTSKDVELQLDKVDDTPFSESTTESLVGILNTYVAVTDGKQTLFRF